MKLELRLGGGAGGDGDAWRAQPFRHAVFDDVLASDALDELMAVLDEAPVERYEADLYVFEATAAGAPTPELAALTAAFGAALAPELARATGIAVTRADLRAFAYRVGHYLLPHTDRSEHQVGDARELAWILYLPTPDAPRGGELELFDCAIDAASGELTSTVSAVTIEPRPNRLVVFEVGPRALHQVREVVGGLRLSLAGWFYK